MQGNRNLKILSSLLLLPVLIPLLFMVITDLNKWKIKMQSHARLERSRSLIQLRIHKDEVKWMDKKEILVNGRMFDYKEVSLSDDWYVFTGHYDDKEGKLLKKQQLAREQKEGQRTLLQVFKSLQQLFYEPLDAKEQRLLLICTTHYLRNTGLQTLVLEVNTPPPQETVT
jgi:hypothetical protein